VVGGDDAFDAVQRLLGGDFEFDPGCELAFDEVAAEGDIERLVVAGLVFGEGGAEADIGDLDLGAGGLAAGDVESQ
jgi:hypothetical protein